MKHHYLDFLTRSTLQLNNYIRNYKFASHIFQLMQSVGCKIILVLVIRINNSAYLLFVYFQAG